MCDRRSEGRAADSVEVVGDRFVLARDSVLVSDGRSRGGVAEAVHHGPEGSATGGGEGGAGVAKVVEPEAGDAGGRPASAAPATRSPTSLPTVWRRRAARALSVAQAPSSTSAWVGRLGGAALAGVETTGAPTRLQVGLSQDCLLGPLHAATNDGGGFFGGLELEGSVLESQGMGRGEANFRCPAPQLIGVVRLELADVEQTSGLAEEHDRVGMVALVAADAAVSGSGQGQSVKLERGGRERGSFRERPRFVTGIGGATVAVGGEGREGFGVAIGCGSARHGRPPEAWELSSAPMRVRDAGTRQPVRSCHFRATTEAYSRGLQRPGYSWWSPLTCVDA